MSKLKDVFKDYIEENNLIDVEIENINLFKKSKKLEMDLKTKKQIKITEISSFEEYLKDRFQIQKVELRIQNETKVDKNIFLQRIKEDWKDIVEYLSKNYPLCKAILGTSSVEVLDNKVIVALQTIGADFLNSYKIDKEIEGIIHNLYGEKCKVQYKEEISEESLKEQEDYLKKLEKNACEDLMHEIDVQNEVTKELEQKKKEETSKLEGDNKTSLIFGRTNKIKEKIVKISDLTVDYGKVAIEGKIISVDSRELKNGKTLVMFNLYDGTSTMTCKSFVEQEKIEQVMRKNKKCKKT